MNKNKNKVSVKDTAGFKWFVYKTGKVEPSSWKKQAYSVSEKANKSRVQEKLYGKKK